VTSNTGLIQPPTSRPYPGLPAKGRDGGDAELRTAPAAFRAAVDIARRNWVCGRLTIELPSGREIRVDGSLPGPDGRLVVRDFRFVGRVLASADIGFGEGYMAGEWDTPDLSALLEVFTLNFDGLDRLVEGNIWERLLFAMARSEHDLFLRPLRATRPASGGGAAQQIRELGA